MLNVAVIGAGYWGPNLVRNFSVCQTTEVAVICEQRYDRLMKLSSMYPSAKAVNLIEHVVNDDNVEAVALATPVASHFPLGMRVLESGRHLLLEKPMAQSVAEAEKLIETAEKKGVRLMVDHTFCYTGAVRKLKELADKGEFGEAIYFDSVRVNLGLLQNDVNVIWDLAPHDLSIMDFILGQKPKAVSAIGNRFGGYDLETTAYVTLRFESGMLAHFHVNWMAPVKIRLIMVGGTKKMALYDDMETSEKVRVYDKGVAIDHSNINDRRELLVSYRSGDMWAPRIDNKEALLLVVQEFAAAIAEKRAPLTDGNAGLRVVRILEGAQKSIDKNGSWVEL